MIDFLCGLAPEGETALIIEQKPKAWIPQLPSAPRPEGRAWYISSGSFIIARGLSAQAANCTHVLFIALDDINTKSKIPPLKPTWKIESSPGNYQWGYVLSVQVTTGEAAAALRVICDAGYTDPGAITPVRNFRVPGSINLKEGRDRFASVLTEFNPEVEYTLEQICTALDVVPGAANTAGQHRVSLEDDGTDDVLAWLSDEGHLIRHGNNAGWWGVTCPNAAEHSDAVAEGRYMPSNRAYTCLHAHCAGWDSVKFLGWVAEQGGPKHYPGLREELLATVMQSALAKLTPGDMFSKASDAAAAIAEVERKELGRVEKAAWYARFAYIQDDDSYFDLVDRREISRSTFNALYRGVGCKSVHNDRKIEAAVCYDENRQKEGAPALVGITYAPGESTLCHRDGDVYGNRWRDARPPAGEGDVTPWLAHCEAMVPVASEREHLYDIMAFKRQHPNIKINHAVLHAGDEGCGKDTMWAPMLWAVCGPSLRNRGMLDNDTLGSQWGYELEAEIIILNELKEPDARERRALANKLKPIIAAPPEMIPINRKGLHPYQMLNRCFVLAFSNDSVPISLASQDRRWFAIWSAAPRMLPAAAAKLWTWYQAGGFAAITGWLDRRDVSAFQPAAAPAMTEFKENLLEHGMSMAESYLVEQMRGRKGDFQSGAIGSPFHTICDRLAVAAGVKVPQAALLHALKEAGWIDCGRLAAVGMPTKKHIFCAPALKHYSKSDLRRLVDAPPPPTTLSVVK